MFKARSKFDSKYSSWV